MATQQEFTKEDFVGNFEQIQKASRALRDTMTKDGGQGPANLVMGACVYLDRNTMEWMCDYISSAACDLKNGTFYPRMQCNREHMKVESLNLDD